MKNALFKWLARTFVPDVGASMEQEDTMGLSTDGVDSRYVVVEDRGADVTIFCFAGMAVLYAGMPAFEFRKLLSAQGENYNLVFFRDVQRMSYLAKPDGSPGGVDFFEGECRRIMDELGARYNVTIGASAGGSIAFFLASRLGMDHVIAFSPIFDASSYNSWKHQLFHGLNLKLLFREPKGYAEVFLIMWATGLMRWKMSRQFGTDALRELATVYRDAEPRPRATVFHGRACLPDAHQASLIVALPEARIVQLDTCRHNCAAVLKKRGELGESITKDIAQGLEAASIKPDGFVGATKRKE